MQSSAFSLEHITAQLFDPEQVIQQYLQGIHTGCLIVNSGSVAWFVCINHGQLIYITHSVEPIDRLDTQLKRISRNIKTITAQVRTQLRLSLDTNTDRTNPQRPDYEGIAKLLQDATLDAEQVHALVLAMSRESLESLMLAPESTYTFVPAQHPYALKQTINFNELVLECQKRIEAWKTLGPYIYSPYQRPYLFSQAGSNKLSPERQQQLGKLLKGFSFRHLAILLDQDELRLLKSLCPLILDKVILLRDPQPPYDELPSFAKLSTDPIEGLIPTESSVLVDGESHFDTFQPAETTKQVYRIACVDDSPAMLQTIDRFLGEENLSLFLINESVKALVEIMRVKPDLILMDVGMPKVDGYELCRLLRRHPMFKATPIIMVTGNTGLIDRARAKMVGATDYMTKPFNQHELLKMVFRYLA